MNKKELLKTVYKFADTCNVLKAHKVIKELLKYSLTNKEIIDINKRLDNGYEKRKNELRYVFQD